jgi:hypothetical protein
MMDTQTGRNSPCAHARQGHERTSLLPVLTLLHPSRWRKMALAEAAVIALRPSRVSPVFVALVAGSAAVGTAKHDAHLLSPVCFVATRVASSTLNRA